MCSAVQRLPVFDLRTSSYRLNRMEKGEQSQNLPEAAMPTRPGMNLKSPSKEDLEMAQSLYEHAQGGRPNLPPVAQHIRNSLSPAEERRSPVSTSSTSEQPYETAGSDREQSYAPTIVGVDAVPSGQVCTYV